MINKVKKIILEYKRTILITFEVFWIIVFLINQIMSPSASEIPQFIYVNF
jgi:hypothetical protein